MKCSQGPFLLLFLLLASCLAPDQQLVEVAGQVYRFPTNAIHAFRRQPAYVRISPTDAPYELVYDKRLAHSSERKPRFFNVNDRAYPNVAEIATQDGLVVCRRASAPHSGCAMRLVHDGQRWSLHFPEQLIEDLPSLSANAIRYLDRARAPR